MKKTILIIISVIIGLLVYVKNDEIIIPTDAIRIRIIANSNSIQDLYQKKALKESINKDIYDIVKNAKSSDEANELITNNLDNIKSLIENKTDNFKIEYGLSYYPKKTYKGIIYPAGNYKSLVITLGSGLGNNWWCVLYPPLCLINDNDNTSDVEYQLLVKKVLSLQ